MLDSRFSLVSLECKKKLKKNLTSLHLTMVMIREHHRLHEYHSPTSNSCSLHIPQKLITA